MIGTMFARVSGTMYLGLALNVLLALGCAPLVLLTLLTRPGDAWLVWIAAAVFAVPSLYAAFSVFVSHTDEADPAVVKPFFRAWARGWRRAMPVGGAGVLLTSILVVDVVYFMAADAAAGTALGAAATPFLVVMAALAAATTLGVLVALVDRPDLPVRSVAKAAVYLMVRRWYLTAFSAVCAGIFVAAMGASPALAMGILASPLLFVVWANTRRTMRPLTHVGDRPTPDHALDAAQTAPSPAFS